MVKNSHLSALSAIKAACRKMALIIINGLTIDVHQLSGRPQARSEFFTGIGNVCETTQPGAGAASLARERACLQFLDI